MQTSDADDPMHTPVPEALVEAYRETLFEAHLPGGRVVLSISEPPQGEPRALPDATVTVVTAYNPSAERPTHEENERAQRRLEHYLHERGWTSFAATGYSRDHAHQEPSFAVLGLDRARATELGSALRQAAVYFWDGSVGELLWCRKAP